MAALSQDMGTLTLMGAAVHTDPLLPAIPVPSKSLFFISGPPALLAHSSQPLLSLTAVSYLLALFPSSKGIPPGICSEQTHVLYFWARQSGLSSSLLGEDCPGAGRDSTSPILVLLPCLSLNAKHWLRLTCRGNTPWGTHCHRL